MALAGTWKRRQAGSGARGQAIRRGSPGMNGIGDGHCENRRPARAARVEGGVVGSEEGLHVRFDVFVHLQISRIRRDSQRFTGNCSAFWRREVVTESAVRRRSDRLLSPRKFTTEGPLCRCPSRTGCHPALEPRCLRGRKRLPAAAPYRPNTSLIGGLRNKELPGSRFDPAPRE